MDDDEDSRTNRYPARRKGIVGHERKHTSDKQIDPLAVLQSEAVRRRLPNHHRNVVNLDRRSSSSESSRSQVNNNLGARPKTTYFQNIIQNKNSFGRRPSYNAPITERQRRDSSVPTFRNTHHGRGAKINPRPFPRQGSATAPNQKRDYSKDRKRSGIMGYRRLTELNESNMDERELPLTLISSKGGFAELLNQDDIRPDWIRLLLSIISKACNSTCKEYVLQLLNIIAQSKFLEHHLLSGFLLKLLKHRHMDLQEQTDLSHSVDNIIFILGEISSKLPTFVDKCEVVTIILNKIPDKLAALDANSIDLLRANIMSIGGRVTDILAVNSEEDKSFTKTKQRKCQDPDAETENIPPPNDFRELTICPSHGDIHMEGQAYVRANKRTGKFDDHDHYLDVQFRLLREDYIQPLREGIKEYLQNVSAGKPKAKLADARIYSDVQVVSPKCAPVGIVYRIQFDTTAFKHIRWQASKRLIFGSLVCLSNDNFDTLLFAVVAGREVKDLQQGFVDIRFTEEFDLGGEEIKKVFVMLETTAYFEAYRHVLAGLQEFTDQVPFQRYIVSCETEVRPPHYLLRQLPPKYDLSCFLTEDVPKSKRLSAKSVPVLTTSRWPTENTMCLDDSQVQAVKTALTKEFAIIQGPPGTGKTYVGLKIVRALLENEAAWGKDSPLLVVCYTNHALDQFLEGMLDFGAERLIRVGGRSSSERLQKHTIKQKKLDIKKNKSTRRDIMDGTRDCWREMKTIEDKMLHGSVKLEFTAKGLLSEKALRTYMTEEQFESFDLEKERVFRRTQQFSSMAVWLNLGSGAFGQPGEGFGESYLFSLTPHHIRALAYKLQMEGEGVENVRYFEQMAETLEYQLSNERSECGHNWHIYRIWKLRFQRNQLTELSGKEKRLKLMDAKTGHHDEHQGSRTRGILTAEEMEEARKLRNNVEFIKETLKQVNAGIFRTSCFVFTPEEIAELEMMGHQIDTYFLARWLGYTEVVQALQNLQDLDAEMDFEEADLVDVEEEATTITNHRLLDDEDEGLFKLMRDTERHEQAQKMALSELAVCLNDRNRHQIPNGGWQTVQPSKHKLKRKIKQILNSGEKMTEDEATDIENVWDISDEDRARLYRYWLDLYRNSLIGEIKGFVQEYELVANRLKAVRDDEDFEILKTMKVIGMTTTGAAKYRSLLQRIKPKIIVVEEAAEVLESHIISSLNSSCEHLILIGDHKQLRPSPAVYDLAKRYKLDLSLFERMVNNQIRCDTLRLQHRMRPEIAEILSFIYPELKNHPSVEDFEHVKGVSSDIFFLDHEISEKSIEDTKSRSNHHEALFTAAFCRYLLLQGYEPSQITVLTTYTGQVFELKQTMPRKIYEGVRIMAVDNYQGEENDIIILSLVRSNTNGSIGFLSVDNRVCVALSRAKKGLFVIGNFKLLAKKSLLWSNIVCLLQSKGYCGPVMELYCQNHPASERLKVSTGKHFEGSPEGGCLRLCEARLDCGHQCERPCHVLDPYHKEYKCQKKCTKKCKNGHNCKKICYKNCGNCMVLVTKVVPQCSHEQKVPCHQDPKTFKCQADCPELLSCGHLCANKCSEEHTTECRIPVTRTWPCKHPVTDACCLSPDEKPCPTKCKETLECGHPCAGSCGECYQGRFHKACRQKCGRTLVCGHECLQSCTKACPPCSVICENRCIHSKCKKECGETCAVCTEPCQWKCKHFKCTRLCGKSCNRPPCDHSCPKLLPCGHRCIGLCGEPCPKLCRECDKDQVCEIFFGDEEEKDARFVVLEDCGDTLEVKGMDHWMSMESNENDDIKMKGCPKCTVVIRTSLRYGNRIKKTLQDIDKVKLKIRGDEKTLERDKRRLQRILLGRPCFDTEVNFRELLKKDLSQHQLNVIDNQISLLTSIQNLKQKIEKESQLKADDVLDLLHSMKVVKNLVESLKNFVSDQELKQFKFEILRIWYLLRLLLFHEKLKHVGDRASQKVKHDLNSALVGLTGSQPFTADKETSVKCLIDRLQEITPLGISEDERVKIVNAMGLKAGHWFKCPNGHVYVISECGGAMEESKCPECKAYIGGTQHTLRADNRLASEMDGARYAAWSDLANMNNYQLEDD